MINFSKNINQELETLSQSNVEKARQIWDASRNSGDSRLSERNLEISNTSIELSAKELTTEETSKELGKRSVESSFGLMDNILSEVKIGSRPLSSQEKKLFSKYLLGMTEEGYGKTHPRELATAMAKLYQAISSDGANGTDILSVEIKNCIADVVKSKLEEKPETSESEEEDGELSPDASVKLEQKASSNSSSSSNSDCDLQDYNLNYEYALNNYKSALIVDDDLKVKFGDILEPCTPKQRLAIIRYGAQMVDCGYKDNFIKKVCQMMSKMYQYKCTIDGKSFGIEDLLGDLSKTRNELENELQRTGEINRTKYRETTLLDGTKLRDEDPSTIKYVSTAKIRAVNAASPAPEKLFELSPEKIEDLLSKGNFGPLSNFAESDTGPIDMWYWDGLLETSIDELFPLEKEDIRKNLRTTRILVSDVPELSNFRGQIKKFLKSFMEDNCGSYTVIDAWVDDQVVSSWNEIPRALKGYWLMQRKDFNTDKNLYFFRGYNDAYDGDQNEDYNGKLNSKEDAIDGEDIDGQKKVTWDDKPETFIKEFFSQGIPYVYRVSSSLPAYQAFNAIALNCVENIPGIDSENYTLSVFRSTRKNETKAGILDSASLGYFCHGMARLEYFLTKREVPLCDVKCLPFFNSKLSDDDGDFGYPDSSWDEREVICDFKNAKSLIVRNPNSFIEKLSNDLEQKTGRTIDSTTSTCLSKYLPEVYRELGESCASKFTDDVQKLILADCDGDSRRLKLDKLIGRCTPWQQMIIIDYGLRLLDLGCPLEKIADVCLMMNNLFNYVPCDGGKNLEKFLFTRVKSDVGDSRNDLHHFIESFVQEVLKKESDYTRVMRKMKEGGIGYHSLSGNESLKKSYEEDLKNLEKCVFEDPERIKKDTCNAIIGILFGNYFFKVSSEMPEKLRESDGQKLALGMLKLIKVAFQVNRIRDLNDIIDGCSFEQQVAIIEHGAQLVDSGWYNSNGIVNLCLIMSNLFKHVLHCEGENGRSRKIEEILSICKEDDDTFDAYKEKFERMREDLGLFAESFYKEATKTEGVLNKVGRQYVELRCKKRNKSLEELKEKEPENYGQIRKEAVNMGNKDLRDAINSIIFSMLENIPGLNKERKVMEFVGEIEKKDLNPDGSLDGKKSLYTVKVPNMSIEGFFQNSSKSVLPTDTKEDGILNERSQKEEVKEEKSEKVFFKFEVPTYCVSLLPFLIEGKEGVVQVNTKAKGAKIERIAPAEVVKLEDNSKKEAI